MDSFTYFVIFFKNEERNGKKEFFNNSRKPKHLESNIFGKGERKFTM